MFTVFTAGCDPMVVPSPEFINEFASEIEVNVKLDNGERHKMRFASCDSFDSETLDIKAYSHLGLQQVVIRKGGVVIHQLDQRQLSGLLNQQRENTGDAIWSVGPQGIRLVLTSSTSCYQKANH